MSVADMAAIISRAPESQEDADWAALGQAVAEMHTPEDGHCRQCGQEWATFPDFPGCETYLEVRLHLVQIIGRRVQKIAAKYWKGT